MRKFLTMVSIAGLAVSSVSMVSAQSGESPVARDYQVDGFDEVSVEGPHHVVISVGSAYSVRGEGPQRPLDDTEVEVEDGRLIIRPIEDERSKQRNHEPATFHVTLPRIAAVSLAGGGDMRVDRVEGEAFSAGIAGSGDIDVAALRVADAHFSIAGSGDLAARGSARRSRISIAGSGNLRTREVRSDEASVSIAGSGNVALTVENEARVSIVGSGDVDIAGPARCSVSRLGGGEVRCGGKNVG